MFQHYIHLCIYTCVLKLPHALTCTKASGVLESNVRRLAVGSPLALDKLELIIRGNLPLFRTVNRGGPEEASCASPLLAVFDHRPEANQKQTATQLSIDMATCEKIELAATKALSPTFACQADFCVSTSFHLVLLLRALPPLDLALYLVKVSVLKQELAQFLSLAAAALRRTELKHTASKP